MKKLHMHLLKTEPSATIHTDKPNKTMVYLFFILSFIFTVQPVSAGEHNYIVIGTGSSSGVYFQAGNAICRMLHKKNESNQHKLRCIPAATSGSVDNIINVGSGELDFGIVQSDIQYHAYNGDTQSFEQKYSNLRSVLSLYSEPFHLLVAKKSAITGWHELAGKRVNLGSPGSGIHSIFNELIRAYAIDQDFFARTTELTVSEQAQALCKGRIDAYGESVGIPSKSVARVVNECGASIVSLDSQPVSQLISSNPYLYYLTIPAGTYTGIDHEVSTLGVVATVVTSTATDEKTVYDLVDAVFENIDHLREAHPAFANLEPEEMACRGLLAPLHEGAKRYFAEHGLNKCP